MGLPAIPPYPLPATLPQLRVSWRPDPHRALLLVHDMQEHFLRPYAGAPIPQVVANINRLRGAGVPVVFTAQPGDQDPASRALLTDFWGPGPAADAVAITPELTPQPQETVLTKHRYSAFVRTALADALGGRDQLLITGIYGHIGILATALDGFMRDIQVFVVADAIADFSADDHEWTLHFAASRCATVTTTDSLLDALGADPAQQVDPLLAELAELVADLLGMPPAEIGPDDDLLDHGLDSVRIMTMVERFRAAGADVDFPDLAQLPTLRAWRTLRGSTS